MVVEIDFHRFEPGELIPGRGETLEELLFGGFKQLPPVPLNLLEGPGIYSFQGQEGFLPEFRKLMKLPVPQGSHHPVLHLLHRILHRPLVPGRPHPGGKHCRPVVPRHLQIGLVQLDFIPPHPLHPCLQVVRYQQPRYPSEILKPPHMPGYPGLKAHVHKRLGIDERACREYHHEKIDRVIIPPPVAILHRHSRPVYHRLVPCLVDFP